MDNKLFNVQQKILRQHFKLSNEENNNTIYECCKTMLMANFLYYVTINAVVCYIKAMFRQVM